MKKLKGLIYDFLFSDFFVGFMITLSILVVISLFFAVHSIEKEKRLDWETFKVEYKCTKIIVDETNSTVTYQCADGLKYVKNRGR